MQAGAIGAEVVRQDDAALSTVRLSAFGLRRDPPRPAADRRADYERLFDYDTLFYDVFRTAAADEVICLGPPLLNCEPAIAEAVFRIPDMREALRWSYRPPSTHFQPSCQLRLKSPVLVAAQSLVVEIAGRRLEMPVRPSGQSRFAGRRVITTLSKDNPLPWIRDWAAFNVRVHGADAILLYDNVSTTYDADTVVAFLKDLPGLVDILVVPWPFPFGPGTGPRNIQDSFFCQPGALTHARWRYCGHARGVLYTDIDELVVPAAGEPIFDRLERSGKAALVFPGLWVESVGMTVPSPEQMRHSDCLYGERRQAILRRLSFKRRLLRTKWIVAPERCPDDVEWGVHDLYRVEPQSRRQARRWKAMPRDVCYRHFRQINTGWKIPRWVRRRYSPLRHIYDRELARLLAVAFPERRIEPPVRRFVGASAALRWFRRGPDSDR